MHRSLEILVLLLLAAGVDSSRILSEKQTQDVGSPCTAYCDGLTRQLAQHQEVKNWKLHCNEDIEGNDIVPRGSGTLRVNGIGECAMACFKLSPDSANLSNATKCKDKERRRECCQSFVYKPSSNASKDSCFLKWEHAYKVSTPSVQGACPASFVGAYYPKGCTSCSEVWANLTHTNVVGNDNINDWNLSCNINIEGHDLGVQPDLLNRRTDKRHADTISDCAERCMRKSCQQGETRTGLTMQCCQAFTYVYDSDWAQNCFLKGGMMASVEVTWAKDYQGFPGCVGTASVWRPNMSLCDIDPQCSQSMKDAQNALSVANNSSQIAYTSMILSGVALGISFALGLLPSILFCIERCRWPVWPWSGNADSCCCCRPGAACDPLRVMRPQKETNKVMLSPIYRGGLASPASGSGCHGGAGI